jgi:dephospho-CoA kinase
MGYVVGLTGGIGSGKSEVARCFAALGADIIDADAVSHRLTQPGAPGWQALRAEFGSNYFLASEELDRVGLRRAVFANPTIKARLEQILHPLIAAEIDNELAACRAPYAILMVPLLIETGRYKDRIDRLLVVDCPEATQIARVKARSRLSEQEIAAIMAAQASRADRLAAADDVIDNGGPLDRLDAQVERLDGCYRAEAVRSK